MQTWITGRMFSFFKNALGARARFASTFSASHCFLGLLHVEKENLTERKGQKFLECHSLQRELRKVLLGRQAHPQQLHGGLAHCLAVKSSTLMGWRPFPTSLQLVSNLSISVEDHLQEKRSSARGEDI